MVRISGIDLIPTKRTDIGITKLYGVGRSNAKQIIKKAGLSAGKRIKDLTEEEVSKLQKVIDEIKVEGELRREVADNIKKLKEIGAYRGIRHSRNLPARGQRTRSNARTKRGKRMTIGAIKKEIAQKMGIVVEDNKDVKKDKE